VIAAPGGALSEEGQARYRRDGILFPIRVFEPDEIARMSERLDALRRAASGVLPPMLIVKPHLLVPWLWDVVHDSRILDLVESLLGPNLLCWNSNFFDKAATSPQRIYWHQDATYWALSRPDALTVWIALSPSTSESGCLRVIPASHDRQLPHEESLSEDDMLIGREKLAVEIDESRAIDVELQPGEISVHHPLIIHGSRPNSSRRRRTGLALRFVASDVERTSDMRGFATLVRGRDYGNWELEQAPEGELDRAALRRQPDILRKAMQIFSAEVHRTRSHAGRTVE